jgi:ppGpp synthetase/RelA/SpoT-type nucleotidyltranferase
LEVIVDVSHDGILRGVPVEVQLRTVLQEAWGNYTHEDFYHGQSVPEPISILMQELSELLHWADRHAALLVRETVKLREQAG